jgi:hypothetical protein
MNAHDFYNRLSDRVQAIPHLRADGIWKYPEEFRERYNAQAIRMANLVDTVKVEMEKMTALEQEQMKYTAGGRKEDGSYAPDTRA